MIVTRTQWGEALGRMKKCTLVAGELNVVNPTMCQYAKGQAYIVRRWANVANKAVRRLARTMRIGDGLYCLVREMQRV